MLYIRMTKGDYFASELRKKPSSLKPTLENIYEKTDNK